MTKKYRLAVSDIVQVFVTGFTLDALGAEKPFSVKLQCDRVDADAVQKISEDKKQTIDQVLTWVTKGWAEQDLVLDEGGLPAEFCPEAFATLLSMPRFSGLAYVKYLAAIGAQQKN